MRQDRLILLQAMPWFLLMLFSSVPKVASGASAVREEATPGDTKDELKNFLLSSDDANDNEDTLSEKAHSGLVQITKRSTHDYDDPSASWDHDYYYHDLDQDSNALDPGYQGYLQYDHMMGYGRRKRTRGGPYYILPKRNSEIPEYAIDPYYHLAERRNYPQDDYMESVYMPYHFFPSFKRSQNSQRPIYNKLTKRSPSEMGAKGFHEGIFTHNFGEFSPVRRKKRETEKADTYGSKTSESEEKTADSLRPRVIYNPGYGWNLNKRRFGMDASGFHGDTFNDGWGTFSTMRKRLPEWDYNMGDQFADGYGYLNMYKRRPEMDSMGFHGDTFNGGFGDFYTMKRRPEMDSSGFYGDTFSSGFGDFYTMKKRRQDAINPQHRSKREAIMPKRRPEMTSSGFYGDTFSNGFGDFYTMKRMEDKRRPEMTSSGFYGDTFSNGFGDFYTMRKRLNELRPRYVPSPVGTEADTLLNTMRTELQKHPKNR